MGVSGGQKSFEKLDKEQSMLPLVLYFREYCSLCHQMRDALAPWLARGDISLEIRDVDSCEDWLAKYDEQVPVLLAGDQEICHWHLDIAQLEAAIAQHKSAVL